MPGQTTISLDPAVAVEGMINDIQYCEVISRTLTDAAGIGAGRVVKNGATIGDQCAALTTAGDFATAIGVTILNLYRMPTTPRFLQYSDISLLRRGLIWMTCVDDCRTMTNVVHIVTSGANAGLPQLSAVGADLGVGIQCLQGGNVGALGLFSVNFAQ